MRKKLMMLGIALAAAFAASQLHAAECWRCEYCNGNQCYNCDPIVCPH